MGITADQLKLRQDFHIKLDILKGKMMASLKGWHIAAQNVGSAYALACERHKDAVAEAAKQQALDDAALFSVLTVCCAGGLGWLAGTTLARGKNGLQQIFKLSNDGFENAQDTTVVISGKALDLVQLHSQRQFTNVSENPQVYQNDITNRILAEEKNVELFFVRLLEEFQKIPMEDFTEAKKQKLDEFDKKISDWTKQSAFLKGGDSSVTQPEMPPVETMARKLERGIWAQWIARTLIKEDFGPGRIVSQTKSERERRYRMNSGYTMHYQEDFYEIQYTKIGAAIEKRLNILNITNESDVGDFGRWTSDDEIEKVVVWAHHFVPTSFM